MSYLELRSLHVLVADAADEVGREVVKEFLSKSISMVLTSDHIESHIYTAADEGCNVTALFQKQISTFGSAQLFTIHGECSDERFVESCMKSARDRFGPINVLVANVKVNEDSYKHPMWETPLDFWEHAHKIDVRGQIPLVRHFLISARVSQELSGLRLENLTIIITHYEDLSTGGPTCVKCTSDKRSIDYSPRIMDDMQTLTVHARTNYVFLARVENLLLKQNLDGSKMILGEYDQT